MTKLIDGLMWASLIAVIAFSPRAYACVLDGTGNGPCNDAPSPYYAPPPVGYQGPPSNQQFHNYQDRNGFTHHCQTNDFGGTPTTSCRD